MTTKPKPRRCPPCPLCGTAAQATPVGVRGGLFHCGRCGGLYDDDPEEGGDFHDTDPSRRLIRAERDRKPLRRPEQND